MNCFQGEPDSLGLKDVVPPGVQNDRCKVGGAKVTTFSSLSPEKVGLVGCITQEPLIVGVLLKWYNT
jgi:hypothetical protein